MCSGCGAAGVTEAGLRSVVCEMGTHRDSKAAASTCCALGEGLSCSGGLGNFF